MPRPWAHLSHLLHVELEPLKVQEQHVRKASDARSLERVALLIALRAKELVVSCKNLRFHIIMIRVRADQK